MALEGPAREIQVEPLEAPAPREVPAEPTPAREPVRAPEREPAGV